MEEQKREEHLQFFFLIFLKKSISQRIKNKNKNKKLMRSTVKEKNYKEENQRKINKQYNRKRQKSKEK